MATFLELRCLVNVTNNDNSKSVQQSLYVAITAILESNWKEVSALLRTVIKTFSINEGQF